MKIVTILEDDKLTDEEIQNNRKENSLYLDRMTVGALILLLAQTVKQLIEKSNTRQ